MVTQDLEDCKSNVESRIELIKRTMYVYKYYVCTLIYTHACICLLSADAYMHEHLYGFALLVSFSYVLSMRLVEKPSTQT